MPRRLLAPPPEKIICPERNRNLLTAQNRQTRNPVLALEQLDFFHHRSDIPLFVLGMNEAVLPVAINGVPSNQPLDRSLGFLPQRIEQMRLVFAEPFLERALVAPLAGMQLSAIAARSPPPDLVGLNQNNRTPAFCQMQRRREARIAPANNTDIRLHIPAQGRARNRTLGGRGIIRRRVRLFNLHHVTFGLERRLISRARLS